MKKNTSWKFTDELSVTFQSSVSGAGEFGLSPYNSLNFGPKSKTAIFEIDLPLVFHQFLEAFVGGTNISM